MSDSENNHEAAHDTAVHVPLHPAVTTNRSPGSPAMRITSIAIVGAFAVGAIVGARSYRRPEPPPDVPAPGMTVGSGSNADWLKLTPNAEQWKVLKLAKAPAAGVHWIDPVPARVVIDESKASRLGSPLAGRVSAVMVERGEHVKAGAALFTVSSPTLAEIRADREKALVELATAKTSLARTQGLVDAQSAPAKELVDAKQTLAEAELAVRLADAKLSSLRVGGTGNASFTVTAPRDGVVVEKNVAVGQEVTPDSGVSQMAIADLSDVWVVADLFESDIGGLKAGAQARVTIDGRNGPALEGTVSLVSAVVDADRHTVPIRVTLQNPDGALRPNAYAELQVLDPTPAVVDLPASAVMSDGSSSFVYLQMPDGALKKHIVVAGSVRDGIVPIYKGVDVGATVVVQGAVLIDNHIQLSN